MSIKDLALRILISLQDNTGPGQRSIRQGIQSVSTQLDRVRRQVLEIASIGVLAGLGRAIFNTVVQLQAAIGLLANVEGGLAAARASLDFLRRTANDLGLSFLDLPKQYALFRAAVKEANYSVDESRRVFKNFMSGLSGLSATEEVAGRVFTALRQMATNPKLALEELKTQLGEQLPGVMAIAYRSMGPVVKSYDDFLDKISKGKINSAEFIKAFSEAFAQKFPAITQGAAQALNRLENAWTDVKTAIGDSGFVDALAASFERLAATMRDGSVQAGMRDFGATLGGLINLISANAGTVLKVLGAIAGFSVGSGFGATLGPLGSFIGGLAGAGAGIAGANRLLADANKGSFQLSGTLEGLGKQYAELMRKTAELRKANEANPMRPFTERLAQTEAQAKAVMARIKEMSGKRGEQAEQSFKPGNLLNNGGDSPRGGKDDAYQAARGLLEAQRAANRAALEDQQETLKLSEAALKRQLDDGILSHESYYAQLKALREADFDAQIAAAKREVELTQQALKNLPKDKGQASAEAAKLNEALAEKMREVGRLEAAKAEAVSDLQSEAAKADRTLAGQLDQVKLKLLELRDVPLPDIIPADKLDEFTLRARILREQYAQLIDELKAKGDIKAVINVELLIKKEAWQQINGEMTEFAKQGARNVQDSLADFLADPKGSDGIAASLVSMLRRVFAQALSASILKSLFPNGGLEGVFLRLFGLVGAGQPAIPTGGPGFMGLPAPGQAVRAGQGFAITPGKNLTDGFFSGLRDNLKTGFDGLAQTLGGIGGGVWDFFSSLGGLLMDGFSALSGLFSGGGGGFLEGLGSIFAGLFHQGGVVGQGGGTVRVPSYVFAGAPRFHSGGFPGLAANEVPIVALKGEEVLRRDDPRHALNGGLSAGGGVTVAMSVSVDNRGNGALPGAVNKGTADLKRMVEATVNEWAVKQKRPGGLLAGAPA